MRVKVIFRGLRVDIDVAVHEIPIVQDIIKAVILDWEFAEPLLFALTELADEDRIEIRKQIINAINHGG